MKMMQKYNNSKLKVKIRKLFLILSSLTFAEWFMFVSPSLSVEALLHGAVIFSVIFWFALFISSFIWSRRFCSYLCPLGGICDMVDMAIRKKMIHVPYLSLLKYLLWTVWMALFIFALHINNEPLRFDLFLTPEMIAMARGHMHSGPMIEKTVYISIILLIVLTSLLGRRFFCRFLCPFSPLMIIGVKTADLLRMPRLKLEIDSEKCTQCRKCESVCTMNIPLIKKFQDKQLIKDSECIACGNCYAVCPEKAIKFIR